MALMLLKEVRVLIAIRIYLLSFNVFYIWVDLFSVNHRIHRNFDISK